MSRHRLRPTAMELSRLCAVKHGNHHRPLVLGIQPISGSGHPICNTGTASSDKDEANRWMSKYQGKYRRVFSERHLLDGAIAQDGDRVLFLALKTRTFALSPFNAVRTEFCGSTHISRSGDGSAPPRTWRGVFAISSLFGACHDQNFHSIRQRRPAPSCIPRDG